MNIGKITSNETSILKAISIFMIVLHNALHPFFPVTINGGNEFDFNSVRIHTFIHEVGMNVLTLPNMLFATFGYCGVFLFFFLSAYGISVKYGDKEGVGYWPFINKRITKILLPVLLVSILMLLFLILGGNRFGSLKDITVSNFLLRLSMLSNFSFDQTWKVIGPWWFLSTIIQFYLIFHVMNRGYKKYGGWFYVIISALSMIVMFFFNAYLYDREIIALRATVIGWLPEISMGCYFARNDKLDTRPITAVIAAILSLAIYVLGNVIEPLWVLSSMAILLFMIIIARPALNAIQRSGPLTRFLIYTGNISVYMFLLSGIIREPFVHGDDLEYWQQSIVALALLVSNFVLSALLFALQRRVLSFIGYVYRFRDKKELGPGGGTSFELIAVVVLGSIVAVELFFINYVKG